MQIAMRTAVAAAALGLAFALVSFAASAQQLYRWVDKNGKVTYSQDPPPAGAAAKVEQKRLQSSVVETGGLGYETQQTAKNFPVTLYTGPDCSDPCKNARALLSKRGVPFKEIPVTDNVGIAELKKISGKEQLPVLLVGRTVTTGFQEGQWNGALDLVGYPKNAPALAPAKAAPAVPPKPVVAPPPAQDAPQEAPPAANP
jgi:glutaredoxin